MPPAHALRRRVRSPATFYAFGTAVFIYRDLRITDAPRVLLDSARVSVMLKFIICNAFLFGHVLTTAQIPQDVARLITDARLAPWQFLLIAGSFMELSIDPIHLGIVYAVNMEIGLVTPPVGLNLFVASGIIGLQLTEVVRRVAVADGAARLPGDNDLYSGNIAFSAQSLVRQAGLGARRKANTAVWSPWHRPAYV